MPFIPGTVPLTGLVAPTGTADAYAVIDPIYGIDGLRSVADHAERNAITTLRRREGMLVYTQNDGQYWKLLPSPWAGDDTDWSVASFGTQGYQGQVGAGTQGPQGVAGSSGSNGAQGNQGVAGVGTQGNQGTQGVTGSNGSQGITGVGTQGNQGTQGVAGSNGLQGTQGVTGIGTQGSQGPQGVAGTQGNQGLTGAGDLSSAVILAPASSTRNVIQSTGDFLPLTIKRKSGQTQALLEVQDDLGTGLFRVNANGEVDAFPDSGGIGFFSDTNGNTSSTLIDLRINDVSKFKVDGLGKTTADWAEFTGGNQWTTANWKKAVRLGDLEAIQLGSDTSKYGMGSAGSIFYIFDTTTELTGSGPSYRVVVKNGKVGINNVNPGATLSVSGGVTFGRTTTSSNYTVTTSDCLVGVLDTSTPKTITLPAANSFAPGQFVTIIDESGGSQSNNITVNKAGADSINGTTSAIIDTPYGVLTLVSDGASNWYRAEAHGPQGVTGAQGPQGRQGLQRQRTPAHAAGELGVRRLDGHGSGDFYGGHGDVGAANGDPAIPDGELPG